MQQIMTWILDFAATPWGPFVLIVNAYLEAVISPFPHDPVLMTVALADQPNSLVYGLISVLSATLGIATSYGLGRWGRKTSLVKIFGNKHFAQIQKLILRYKNRAIFIALFTPFPDKIFSFMAGLMKLDFKVFLFLGFLSRALRYFLTATLVYLYGETIRTWLIHSLPWVLIALVVAVLILYFATKMFYSFLNKKIELSEGDKQVS